MGVSTTGLLFYGRMLPDEFDLYQDRDGIDGVFLKIEDALRAKGLDAVATCSSDYTTYAIVHRKTLKHAYRGYPKDLDLAAMMAAIPADIETRIDEFIREWVAPLLDEDDEVSSKSTWILASYWG